jgi:hypothetical protein
MRIALGVYVLGAIDPAERSRLEGHLRDCPSCRDELAGMAGLPALLGRVSEPQIELEDGELLESLLARAAAEPRPVPVRPRRRRVVLLALSVAAALLIGVILGGVFLGQEEPSTTKPVAAEQVDAVDPITHVWAKLHLTPKHWGTALEVEISGAPTKAICHMIAVGVDGQRDPAGSWKVVSTKDGYGYYGSTGIDRADLREIKIVTKDGKDLVTIPVT